LHQTGEETNVSRTTSVFVIREDDEDIDDLETLVYPPFYHLTWLLAQESSTELKKDTKACHKTQYSGQQLNPESSK
jgi:hypothetical protein